MMIEDDIYGDLENFNDENNLNDLKTENGRLRDEVENLKLNIENLTEENLVVKKKFQDYKSNISSLLMTARLEVERKDRLIADLNKEKDELVFRKFNQQNTNKFNYPKLDGAEDTGQKRKFERPEHYDAKKLKMNNQGLDSQQPTISTAPNTEHINSNTTKTSNDKNCLQKLIFQMEEDNSSNKSKASKIKLNRRKSICGYKVDEDKPQVQLHEIKHEINESDKNANSYKVDTNRTKRLSPLENNKMDHDDKYGLQNNILKCNIDKSVKNEMSRKRTVCDSTTASPKEGDSNVPRMTKQKQEDFQTKEKSEQKNAFKIQRSRRQSMNEDIFRKRDSPELPASIHLSQRNYSRDDFHTRRARNASCDRQRDLRATLVHRENPRNRPHSHRGSHDRQPDPRSSSYDSRPDSRNGYHERRPDPPISSRISLRDPRKSAACDNRPDARNVDCERRPDPCYASRDRRCRESSFSTRHSERTARDTYTKSHSKERYNVDTHSRHRSCQKPNESHKTLISTTKIDEKLNIRENVSAEDMANTLSLRYSDSDESNSNLNIKELDSRRKMSEEVDLRQCLVDKLSNFESDATMNNRNTFHSATVKSENNDGNQFSQLDSHNDVYAYISTLSNQSTERTTPLDSLSIDKGSAAGSAPTFHLYQDHSQKLPTSGYTKMSPSDQIESQTVEASQNERKVLHNAPKTSSILCNAFMEYALHKIDDAPFVNSKSSSNISNTDVKDAFELISSTLDPRQKQFTVKNVNTENKELLELFQKNHIKVDDLLDKACIEVDGLLNNSHIKVEGDLVDKTDIKVDYDLLNKSHVKVEEDLLDKAYIKVDDDLLDKSQIKVDEDLIEEAHIKVDNDLLDKVNGLVNVAPCTAPSSLEIKNKLPRKSPRKNNKKFKIPKIQSNGKEDLPEVSELQGKKICSYVEEKKGFIINQDQKSKKIKDQQKKNKNKYENIDSKVLIDKPESKPSEVTEAKRKESKSSRLRASQDTIFKSSSDNILAKAPNACRKDSKRSTESTESFTTTNPESSHIKTVKTHKIEATTTSSNKEIDNKDKKQSVVKTTQKTNECLEHLKEIHSSELEEIPTNENHRKLNECSENVRIPTDKALLSKTKDEKYGVNERESEKRAEKIKLDKISERTSQTKFDQLRKNDYTNDLISSQGETVNKRRKLYSHMDDGKDTSDTLTLCNKHNVDRIVDIKQDACRNTLQNNGNKNEHSTKDLKYLESTRMKKKARSVIIRSNDICEDETSTEKASKVTDEENKKEQSMKDTSKPDIHLLIAPNIDRILIKETETSSKILWNKEDNLNANLRNSKKTQDFPQCHSEQKYTLERNNEDTKSQKLEDKQTTVTTPTHYSRSTDNKSLPSDEGNYIIKIRRKRKIIKTF